MMLALGVAILIASVGQLWFLLAIWWCLRRMTRRSLDLPTIGGGEEGADEAFDDSYYGINYLRGDYQ